MVYSITKLKFKQVTGSFKPVSVLKFLAPDFLVGLFLALSVQDKVGENFGMRVGVVASGIALFTLIVESRRIFFSGGDLEDFYFVQPTMISRFATLLTILLLTLLIILSVVLPAVFLTFSDERFLPIIISISLSAFCSSTFFYLVVVFLIASLPIKVADLSLTIVQIAMALILLAVFQLPMASEKFSSFDGSQSVFYFLFLVSCLAFLVFSVQEKLLLRFREFEGGQAKDLSKITGKYKKFLFVRSDEEEAGFLFFASNIFRNRSFRLSTIGVAATPLMVAVYWSLRGLPFIRFNLPGEFMSPGFVAPIASLITSGVLVQYFLSQNLLSSKDHEGSWMFNSNPEFSAGKFIMGVRKSLLVTIHVPMTVAVFIIITQRNSLLESAIAALTFYFMVHVAISFFSIVQKDLPFTLPFTQISSQGVIDLIFFLLYSSLTTLALFVSCSNMVNLLTLNLFASILVGILELSSIHIIDKRIKLNV